MESLLMAIRSKEGRTCLIGMAAGILISCVGGYLLRDSAIACDIVVVAGSLFSVVGVDKFCRLIIQFREDDDDKK